MRRVAVALVAVAFAAVAATLALGGARGAGAYSVDRLVSDGGVPAARKDPALVNAWGLAAEPGGAWWTANEANDTSTLYSAAGRKQQLTVAVPGGPTGIAFNGGSGFRVSAGGVSAPARFVFACEDGTLRAWSPVVPRGWSTRSEVAGRPRRRRRPSSAASRSPAGRLYATDFHNARVDVFDSRWRRVDAPGAFVDPSVPAWYAPFGIAAIGGHVFVTYIGRAPVDGNDAPTGGYVDEFDLDGKLIRRVGARRCAERSRGGSRSRPTASAGTAATCSSATSATARIDAYRRRSDGWVFDGALRGDDGKPLVINGLWSLAFGAGDRLFFFIAARTHGAARPSWACTACSARSRRPSRGSPRDR